MGSSGEEEEQEGEKSMKKLRKMPYEENEITLLDFAVKREPVVSRKKAAES
jgi:hypothetical protein